MKGGDWVLILLACLFAMWLSWHNHNTPKVG